MKNVIETIQASTFAVTLRAVARDIVAGLNALSRAQYAQPWRD